MLLLFICKYTRQLPKQFLIFYLHIFNSETFTTDHIKCYLHKIPPNSETLSDKPLSQNHISCEQWPGIKYTKDKVWNKVWVKPQGCVVKVFPRGVSKDSQTVP